MPRSRNLFRLENASKDSGLSFHCCGNPDDLLDQPLDCINERRHTSKNTGPLKLQARTAEKQLDSLLVTTLRNEHRLVRESRSTEAFSPGTSPTSSSSWSLHSILSWSSPLGSSSKGNSSIKRFWCKKHAEPSIGLDKELVYNGSPEGSEKPKQLRSSRSMPLLSGPAKAVSRCRSRCLSPMSFAGLDRLVDINHEHEKPTRRESAPQRPNLTNLYHADTDHSSHKDRSNSSKTHSAIFPRPTKISGLLSNSIANWSQYFLNRNRKEGESTKDEV